MSTEIDLGELRAPVRIEQAACANCSGMRYVKLYAPPYGTHTQHDERCQRKYGYCLRLCTVCASGIKAGQITPQLYTWLGDEAGDLPTKTLAGFDRTRQPRAYAVADEWLCQALANTTPLKNVILAGVAGTGKTHLAASVANALQAANIAVLFASAPSFFEAYYAGSFEEKQAFMRRAAEIAVLILDDLDKVYIRPEGEYQKKKFYEMLNRRYVAKKPTWITTNAQDSLKTWLDPATISRIFEHVKLVPMNGADYRLRKDAR